LVKTYFGRLVQINSAASNAKTIVLAQRWLAQNEIPKSKYGRYFYLGLLRDLRIPFRNSGKLNESIEYFTVAEKKYLAAQDSGAVSIVYNVLSGLYNRMGLMEKARYYQLKSLDYLDNSQGDYNTSQMAMLLGKAGKVNRYAVLGSYYVTEKKPAVAEGFLQTGHSKLSPALIHPLLFSDGPIYFFAVGPLQNAGEKCQQQQLLRHCIELLKYV